MAAPQEKPIADRYTRRQFALIRFANGLSASNDADLRSLGRRLRVLLRSIEADFRRRELPGLLRELEQLVNATYKTIADRAAAHLGEVGAIEAAFASNASAAMQEATAAAVQRAMRTLLVQGALLSDQWDRAGADLSWKLTTAVREGISAGRDGTAIADALGTARDMRGGLIQQAQRSAATVTETSVFTAAFAARLETFKASGVNALEWHSILDGKTTLGCAARAGLLYTLDLEPIGHTVAIERPPPRHWNCRSILLPLKYPDGVPPDGKGPGETLAQWLDRHTQTEQDQMLGPGRAQMWRDGKITLSDLLNQRGQALTLDELRAL